MDKRVLRLALAAVSLVVLAGCNAGSGIGLGGVTSGALEVPCSQLTHSDARLEDMSDTGIGLTSQLGLASGRYALPSTDKPTQLVVNFHGHNNNSCAWRNHLRAIAARGAVTFAMDYTGQYNTDTVDNAGWFARAGAADSIAAAKYFLRRYPSIKEVIVNAISMGGSVSGVAIYSPDAKRDDGTPLFDYYVASEGVHNLIEEYTIARAVAPAVPDAALAQTEIETENGGPIESVPTKYQEITNVLRVQDMAYLKGAILVHGIDDGLVPTTQSREMMLALNLAGVPTHLFTVGGTGGGEDGTTATGIIASQVFGALGQDYGSPLAGHGWEGSDTHLVINTGFEQLFALMGGANTITPGETPVPGL